jgi:hypothetical protein
VGSLRGELFVAFGDPGDDGGLTACEFAAPFVERDRPFGKRRAQFDFDRDEFFRAWFGARGDADGWRGRFADGYFQFTFGVSERFFLV